MKILPIYNKLLSETKNNSIIAYHGTNHKFDNFTDDFVGGKDAYDQEGPGIYFTSSLKNASSYGSIVYRVNLRPNKIISTKISKAPINQIEFLIKQAPDWEASVQNWDESIRIGLKKACSDILQYNETPHLQFQQVWVDFYRSNSVQYVRNMTKLGYDMVVIPNRNSLISNEENITHYVVLNPNIIEVVDIMS